ncbi:hypothetical protein [Rhodopirellula sallentina]|uniref:hypothetical protein n=1 Tax=Rhodopirellula sallentina TaxID=1263869 RepID=UPI001181A50A|nr:hypothetical protein [Rhodopirellula sallentina]
MNRRSVVFAVSLCFAAGVWVGCEEKVPPKDPTVDDIQNYIENNPEIVSETERFDPEFRDDPEVEDVDEFETVE